MRNEASRGWLCLSITSIDFALMPPVKLCRAGKADGLGCDQSICPCCTVAIYSYACHLCATTVLGQQRYCVAAIWGQIDALKTPLSTLKYLHLNFTQINSSKGTGVCVRVCVQSSFWARRIPFWAAEINNNNKLKMAAAALAQFPFLSM